MLAAITAACLAVPSSPVTANDNSHAETGIETAAVVDSDNSQPAAMTKFQRILNSLQTAQEILLGETGEDLNLGEGEAQGPVSNSFDRLQVAWANLGHITDEFLPAAKSTLNEGGLSANKVIGADGRTRVTATTTFPWRAICHLEVTWKNGATTKGTGFFISKRTVMTAGHVVYNKDRGGWPKQVTVYAGRNGTTPTYAKVTVQSSAIYSVTGYTADKLSHYDYAAVVLPTTTPGSSTGNFGYHQLTNAGFNGKTFNIAGYPSDKTTGTLWTAAGPSTGFMDTVTNSSGTALAGRFKYTIDTEDGQSGAPVWYQSGSNRYVVGVHTGVTGDSNRASRLGQHMVEFIQRRP